jgi:uncharacterized protein
VSELRVIPPVPDRDSAFFWEGVADSKLLLQACRGCGALRLPPEPMCGRCRSIDWEPRPAAGSGTVVSWIVSRHPTQADAAPRIVALIQLEEGPRIVSNLVEVAEGEVRNDMAVEVSFADVGGVRLHQFRPVGS